MASRVSFNNFIVLSRRSYSVLSTETGASASVPAAFLKNHPESGGFKQENNSQNQPKQNFWMQDPATGNWIPENHMHEMDAAELREKLLPKKYSISGA